MKKLLRSLVLTSSLLLLLTACGGNKDDAQDPEIPSGPVTSEAEPSETPEPVYDGPLNPLTGLPIDPKWAQARPVAVMLNNLKAALPQQGCGEADIIYELPAEGGITRMVGIYQSVEGIEVLGSVRSARPYYIEVALGHDAIFVHAGGSQDAYADLKSWKVDRMDGVQGPYASVFWRDRSRIEGQYYDYEHSLITSGEKILATLDEIDMRREHEQSYRYHMEFAEDGTPANGETANVVTVPFSSYKTGVFRYDTSTRTYAVEEYEKPYIDGNSGTQVTVTNVLVLKTTVRNTNDSYGHVEVELNSGEGYYACGGKIIPITWAKGSRDEQFYYYVDGNRPISLGVGKSYVSVIPSKQEVSWE